MREPESRKHVEPKKEYDGDYQDSFRKHQGEGGGHDSLRGTRASENTVNAAEGERPEDAGAAGAPQPGARGGAAVPDAGPATLCRLAAGGGGNAGKRVQPVREAESALHHRRRGGGAGGRHRGERRAAAAARRLAGGGGGGRDGADNVGAGDAPLRLGGEPGPAANRCLRGAEGGEGGEGAGGGPCRGAAHRPALRVAVAGRHAAPRAALRVFPQRAHERRHPQLLHREL